MRYARSTFRDFASYFRIVVDLNEEGFRLISKQYKSNFVTYELTPGIYSIEDDSEAVYTMGDHEGTLNVEFDDISMKKKHVLTRFVSTFGNLRFDETSFFNNLLEFTPIWDYQPTNAIHAENPGVFTSETVLNLNTIDKNHSRNDVIDGSVVNRIQEPILFKFVLGKPSGYKFFREPETIHYK